MMVMSIFGEKNIREKIELEISSCAGMCSEKHALERDANLESLKDKVYG